MANGINEATIMEQKDVNSTIVSFGTKIEVLEDEANFFSTKASLTMSRNTGDVFAV